MSQLLHIEQCHVKKSQLGIQDNILKIWADVFLNGMMGTIDSSRLLIIFLFLLQ